MLHHDDAPAHTSLLVREFLAKHETTVVHQPPYSPDLALETFFFLFPRLKSTLKGRRFQKIEEIGENSLWDLRAIPQNAFEGWKKLWKQYIDSGEEYFEGDKSY
jgi:transposase